MSMEEKIKQLKIRLAEIQDLEHAVSVLSWDQSTYMPEGGAVARARSMATLARLSQEKFIDPAMGRLLDDLHAYGEGLPYDSDEAALIRVTRRDYERATKIPPDFLGEIYEHGALSYQTWTKARPANDFASMRPMLEKTLDYSRKLADFFAPYDHVIDPLIDFADFGMKAATLSPLFAELRKELVPIVQMITAQTPADDTCLRKHYPKEAQLEICKEIVSKLGYDFRRGRMDLTHHPFETSFSVNDVRITTRVEEDFLAECLYSCIHESGHAMYEQGSSQDFEGTTLKGGTGSGVHESQSRLWENIVGRSRAFCEFFYPRLQEYFWDQLHDTTIDTFYRAINKVEPSLIRTDADEVTYNLHVMLRFDFEMALLEGKLEVKDLPDAWHARFEQDFGMRAPDDRDGVLQDVHWYADIIGGCFQGYTLGNILGSSFYTAALQTHPEIPDQIRQGQFDTLHGWLTENIYRHGRKFTEPELVQRVTGSPIQFEPYIAYLKTKYGELYGF